MEFRKIEHVSQVQQEYILLTEKNILMNTIIFN